MKDGMAGVFRVRPLCCVFRGFAWRYGMTQWTVAAERIADVAHSAPQEKQSSESAHRHLYLRVSLLPRS
ncbi:hypothetical protein [Paraburkholderia fungorum]|uniref:hypothetical protein n=1 Tax=Paraburkholderia fungorum TaxID=134537 RepID=UPI00115FB205|nr:hypothetical protein [Paraburkholderia fungorum]